MDTKTTNECLVELLNEKYPFVDDRWQLPCGLSFMCDQKQSNTWVYVYNEEGTKLVTPDLSLKMGPYVFGSIDQFEVLHFVNETEKKSKEDQSFNIFTKPNSIIMLERITGLKANLHPSYCLIWHLRSPVFSCINNMYGTDHIEANDENEFEVLIEGKKTPYMPLFELVKTLRLKNEVKKQFYCVYCLIVNTETEVPFLRCSGCKSVHYCSVSCQKKAWPIHKSLCKVSK